MKTNLEKIHVKLFGNDIGIIAYDAVKSISYFQYNRDFLEQKIYTSIFPFVIKRVSQTQVFKNYNIHIFKGLPPMIADSLPDAFGNRIFNEWIKSKGIDTKNLSAIHQLAYLSNRGMGALEYYPAKNLPIISEINLKEITSVVSTILKIKKDVTHIKLNDLALLNIFKLGSSYGGARPKVIVSEHKKTGLLIPGDVEYGNDYNHYLIKLNLNNDDYNRELVEFAYYKLALKAGLQMMDSKIIDNQHFATLRYDRVNGEKQHVLTTTGISGFSNENPEHATYEKLFSIANTLNIPSSDMDKLFRRMVFNFAFHNTDDHLKNHSFLYEKQTNRWRITPAYDINYALNAVNKWHNAPHALSLNGKRTQITTIDLLGLAEKHSIKNPKKIIFEVTEASKNWIDITSELDIPEKVIIAIQDDFKVFL